MRADQRMALFASDSEWKLAQQESAVFGVRARRTKTAAGTIEFSSKGPFTSANYVAFQVAAGRVPDGPSGRAAAAGDLAAFRRPPLAARGIRVADRRAYLVPVAYHDTGK